METKPITIFEQTYSDEELCDLERDVLEAISADYNPILKKVRNDVGTFKVTITWEPE